MSISSLSADIYGEKVEAPDMSLNGTTNGHVETRTVIRLSPRDFLREYGPFGDMVFGLARDGVCRLSFSK